MTPPQCLDCRKEGVATRRRATGRPLLCATHRRGRRFDRRNYSWERHIKETYGITPEEYWQIYEAQGRRCYICAVRTGATKKLSVDHDHKTGIIRGLLCNKPCNRDVLGGLRDDISALERAIHYLRTPPAVAVIGERVVPNHES